MASVVFDAKRGIYRIAWHDGIRARRPVVPGSRIPGWREGMKRPKADPPAVTAALLRYRGMESAARSTRPRSPDRTAADFLEEYRAAYAAMGRRESSGEELRRAAGDFVAWLGARRRTLLAEVDRATCRAYLDHLAGQGMARSTVEKRRALLSGAWRRASRRDEVPANPWLNLDNPAPSRRKARGSWSPDQFATLMGGAVPWLRDVLRLGVLTGLRVSALVAVEPSWVDWSAGSHGLLRVPAAHDKAGRGYAVPLHRDAHEVLARLVATGGGGPVLRGHAGGPLSRGTVAHAITDACRRAGLARPDSPAHHMRRTFGRWAVLGQGPWKGRPVRLYVVSRWLGHSSVSMTERYLDISEQASAEAMDAGE